MSLFELPVVSREKVTNISEKKSRVELLYSPDPTSSPSHRKPAGRLGNPHFFESLFGIRAEKGERTLVYINLDGEWSWWVP